MVPIKFSFFPQFQGRALSRAKSRRNLDYMDVLSKLESQGISIRVASPKLVMEEVILLICSLPGRCTSVTLIKNVRLK